jgi:hypothetical protein
VVRDGAKCASACAKIVFLSGTYRSVFDGGQLGIHSCSLGGIRDELCNDKVAKNAVGHGVEYGSVMQFMLTKGPSEMAWLDSWEADCWGYTLWPPEYHRGKKPGDPSPCIIMAFRCGVWNNPQPPMSSVHACVVQKFDTWQKTIMRSMPH